MKKDVTYGCITEQGDLGLGFDVLNEQDQKIMNETAQKEDQKEDK